MVDTRFCTSIQIMVTLGYHTGELMNSEVLAKVLKTNPTFVRKLVSRLVEAGLVESFRGKGGGIRLKLSPSQISLKDIYIASTEDKALICKAERPTSKSCQVSCSMESIFDDVLEGIENSTKTYLSKKTLADMLKKIID